MSSNDNGCRYPVTILMICYHSEFEKIRQTLESIFMQKEVDYEIVLADDGSEDNHEKEITECFRQHHFDNYKLVLNQKNQGTVRNILSGLKVSEGAYIKDISPGDRLVGEWTIRKWVDFMNGHSCDWSFSDAVYYRNDGGKDRIIQDRAYPQIISPYKAGKDEACRWNYVVLRDIALGAVMMTQRDLMEKYICRIAEQGVVYAEDNIWRMMMFEGHVGSYYPETTVLYEYGSGISTSENSVWKERLMRDWEITSEMICSYANPDSFQRRIIGCMKRKRAWSKFMIPGKIAFTVKRNYFPRKTKNGEGIGICR